MHEIRDFDFLLGKWTVTNKRLKERLCSCKEWVEFEAEMETKEILNGLGVMDEMRLSFFGDEFVGLSLRMFNPQTNDWTIYWADTANPQNGLTKQVVGKFEGGIGEFFGTEFFEGEKVNLRFRWKKDSENTANWEQAYFDKRLKTWETNWTMLFTRRR